MKCLALAAAVAVGPVAHAQTQFPSKPVRLIISFTPGSATDIVGRIVATKMAEIWGQPVVPENRPGAGGSIGSAVVVQSPPDGYTLLANSSAHASNPAIYAKLPYDTLKDFTNLSPLAGQANVLIVGPGTGWKTLGDFLAAAKAKPGELNFSSAGLGSGTHLNLEKLMLMTGAKVTHVPYKGTPEAIGDTIAGRVCCYFAPITAAVPHVTGGKAVALGVSTAKRSALLPDVPTIAEAGVPGFEYNLWVGLWGPPGMPADVAAKINKDVQTALASPDVRERLQKLGADPMQMTIPEFTQFVQREVADSQRIIQAAGLKPQ
jgi:tripartite-type tricarboxylate transporter receptor subunit TctC